MADSAIDTPRTMQWHDANLHVEPFPWKELQMHPRLHALWAHAGVAPAVLATLAAHVAESGPDSMDVPALDGATDVQLALLSAMVAAVHWQRCGAALPSLLTLVSAAQHTLSYYDQGRFWHLTGCAALHLEHALDSATDALQRSLTFLGDDAARTRTYRARVYDTWGQLLQRQGLLMEARNRFALALQHWDVADEEGTALVLGHLGQLCMGLGDFASAAEYLGRDLNIVTQRTPERTTLRTQLLAHLGTCALGRGGLTAARNYFQQSKRLAQADGNTCGLTSAALGLGQRAVRCGKMATAQRQVQEAQRQLDAAQLSEVAAASVRWRLSQLVAEIHLAQQRPAEAITAFTVARQYVARAADVSRPDMAHLLHGLARAHLQRGEDAEAACVLRAALQALESTTAERLRQEIQHTLHRHVPELS